MVTTKCVFPALKIGGLVATISLASLVISPKANAVLLYSDSDSFSNRKTELNGTAPLTVDKYNGTGTVDQIIITLFGQFTSSGNLTNNAVDPQDFDVSLTGRLRFTPATGSPSALVATNVIASGTSIGTAQSYTNIAPGAQVTFPTQTASNTYSLTITDLTEISQFLGSGTFSYNPSSAIGTLVDGGGGNIAANISTFADATLSVEYNGTAAGTEVPEPSSILGILALTGSGAAMMRKFKSLVKLN
ncbi:choice-of-anchor E domain-containing protein [Cylindrospermum sp. FACHB-282]|uniref:choice-of-anchor E domain-containing protein n=1 Tax=Cylindrospermum sp. FACHB-282 TaxID=2692794 RepID=UPI0016829851|nr:choice-of-anchor E domain-containing protein [Cylindrospermum sp. FACHB-282]MBD2388529.1 choice-of-anchor E domain-containing protein [Cylindrospermum sp. FACHB-282]